MICEECGLELVTAIGERAVRTPEGQIVVFRRTTDYLLCSGCQSLFSITQIRAANPELDREIDLTGTTLPVFGAD